MSMSGSDKLATTAQQATQVLRAAAIPSEIVQVARVLQQAGHAAVLVGGAVRDVLLGLAASDWDLASSATPSEVQALFERTIPTGIEHGTVTVLVRRADGDNEPVEVTTFRGEGAYVDGRRPTEVTFLRDLEQDLARRDFTVNALAWDPIQAVFSDPFGGLADLSKKVIRAVGDAHARFQEDGLRTMRAVRFCATRELELEPETADAIAGALVVLDKVSRERVLVELTKLLCAPRPSRGLIPLVQSGMWKHILPAVAPTQRDVRIRSVDRLPREFAVRLAHLLWPLARTAQGRGQVLAGIEALKPSRALRQQVLALTSEAAAALGEADTPKSIRHAAAAVSRARVPELMAVLEFDEGARARVASALEGAALSIGELRIAGRDLVAQGILQPGPALGTVLRSLLTAVLDDPTRNEPTQLIELARAAAP